MENSKEIAEDESEPGAKDQNILLPLCKDIPTSAVKAEVEPLDDLINIISSISPEKLGIVIDDKNDSTSTTKQAAAMEVDASSAANITKPLHESQVADDCVILLDSDEEERNKKRPKVCVNPNCPDDSNVFSQCPPFVQSFYFHNKQSKNVPFVCDSCLHKSIAKFEELGEALVNRKSLFAVKLYNEKDLVGIIDSDDEEKQQIVKPPPDPETDEILFNAEVEMEVEDILQDLCSRYDLEKQKIWDNEDIKIRVENFEISQALFDEELKVLEGKSAKMVEDLYSVNKPRMERRPSLEIVDELPRKVKKKREKNSSLPIEDLDPPCSLLPVKKTDEGPQAMIVEQQPEHQIEAESSPPQAQAMPPLLILSSEELFIACRSRPVKPNAIPTWMTCQLLEKLTAPDGSMLYRIHFLDNKPNTVASVTGKEIVLNVVNEKLTVGARVIAFVTKDDITKYYPGVIGERLSTYNNQRYLVFCDNGQVHYASPYCVREVAEQSPEVWEDVHVNLGVFIKEYLQAHRQRALLNVPIGQRVPTERNGKWPHATVVEIDCSVVKIFFPNENAHEWMYRGSKRFAPLYSREESRGVSTSVRLNDPNITIVQIDEDEKQEAAERAEEPQEVQDVAKQQEKPAATTQQQQPVKIDCVEYLDDPIAVTKHKNFTPRAGIAAKRFVAHNCSPTCLDERTRNLAIYSPLTKPLLTCWERLIIRRNRSRCIMYKAPCGRLLRNMKEVHRYVMMTRSPLNVDNFDFDVRIKVLRAYDVIDKTRCPYYHPDLADGKEGMKIPIVNSFENHPPPPLEYSAVRIPMKGVHINTDPEFMACCDCTDDCADKSKCACFQLTMSGHKGRKVSYVWKRLLDIVQTGIYECHSRCACSSRCFNRVAQQPIQVKMLLVRTKDRGWGLECQHDIPKGTFISIYAGRLYTEAGANALGHGDDYFAQLDLIETATSYKEGYEHGVAYEDSDSDVESEGTSKPAGNPEIPTGTVLSKSDAKDGIKRDSSDDDSEVVNMVPCGKVRLSLRKLFGAKERPHTMDAMQCGNVGRYFNHSCDPNVFVQSVYVDTHDMRFPWISLFALRTIQAGEELTWDYNYEVGIVPSRVLYCKCGAENCRGRIL